MFEINKSLFGNKQKINIPGDIEIIFVSDMFLEDYALGGAERTSQALINFGKMQFNIFCLRSKDITMELLEQNFKKFWIFGNYTQMDTNLIPSIVANIKYSIIEYDYKYCAARLPSLHKEQIGTECVCENEQSGKLVSAFYYGAKSLFWMSEAQKAHYFKLFPFLEECNNMVLSSVFDDAFFIKIKELREIYKEKNDTWLIFDSPSWVKGANESIEYAKKNNLKYEKIWGLSYDETLNKLAQSKGVIALFNGWDTCPRNIIENKLLGGKLITNDNCQMKDEIWFDTNDLLDTESYLFMSRQRFWQQIKNDINFIPKLSGFLTTNSCESQNYPYKLTIQSLLGVNEEFCDEVIVVDTTPINKNGKSADGTLEILREWEEKEPKLKVHHFDKDNKDPLNDGKNKAIALSLCSNDFAFYMDADEIIHEQDYKKFKKFLRDWPKGLPGLMLPVNERWCAKDKTRIDINLNKWRIFSLKDMPAMTFGVPRTNKKFDKNGNLYVSPPGSCDGCFPIHMNTEEMIPFASVWSNELEKLKQEALNWSQGSLLKFEQAFNDMIEQIGAIEHFSWYDVLNPEKTIETKIKRYIGFGKNDFGWTEHWNRLYKQEIEDTAENNPFANKKMKEMTEGDIKKCAEGLKDAGGWIFHNKYDGSKRPTIKIKRNLPKIVEAMAVGKRN